MSVAWPSGLRRWFKAPVSSEAWVRIPPLPSSFCSFWFFSTLYQYFAFFLWKLKTKFILILKLKNGGTVSNVRFIGPATRRQLKLHFRPSNPQPTLPATIQIFLELLMLRIKVRMFDTLFSYMHFGGSRFHQFLFI